MWPDPYAPAPDLALIDAYWRAANYLCDALAAREHGDDDPEIANWTWPV